MNAPAHLSAWVEGIGLIAPGLPDWPSARAVLRGESAWQPPPGPTALPAPDLLPAAERRRASRIVKAALAAGSQACHMAGRDAATLTNVFASSGGDGDNCHLLCEQLAADDVQVSPTRFHNSVHNAASGYWSIATGATPAAQVLGAHDASFAAGLLEAMTQTAYTAQPVLLVAADSEYPPPLHAKRPVAATSALALVLSPTRTPAAVAELRLPLHGALCDSGMTQPALAADPAPTAAPPLHTLSPLQAAPWLPPLRGLPLLAALLSDAPAAVALHYLPPQKLRVHVCPVA